MGENSHDVDSVMSASPGQLKQAVAELFQLPTKAIDYPWRALREAGLVSKGGRGASAAKVTPRDAAFLLIAVAAQLHARDIIHSAILYATLELFKSGDDVENQILPLSSFKQNPTFLDCLEFLIRIIADGSLRICDETDPQTLELDTSPGNQFSVGVLIYAPFANAYINLVQSDSNYDKYFFMMPDYIDAMERTADIETEPNSSELSKDGDLRVMTMFSTRTLFRLGELIGSEK